MAGGGVANTGPAMGGNTSAWTNATSNLVSLSSECGNLSNLSAKPDEDLLIAGIALNGLWGSSDGGQNWTQMGTGKGSDSITNRPTAIVYDPQNPARFWESGIYGGFGIFRTDDNGNVLKVLGDFISSDLVSVDFSDPARMTLLAGGHEAPKAVSRSTDGGMTWVNIGSTLPEATNCTFPLIVDSTTYLMGCEGPGGLVGTYRSTNGGASWSSVSKSGGGAAPLRASDGSIYWANAGTLGMVRSTDDGETWQDLAPISPPGALGNTINIAPVELPDGRIATLNQGNLLLSADQGASWQTACAPLPFDSARGLAYSAQQKAFFVWHFSCGAPPLPVPTDAIMRCNFDYQAE